MEEVLNEIPDTNIELTPAECDLASLVSIKNFVSTTLKEENSLDVVCYNAGIARNTAASECLRTKEGFELTVGTNHFGHFYLNQLILPKIKQNTGRIVVTASSVHDPDSPGGAQGSKATLGTLEGLKRDGNMFEMVDGEKFDADKAYKDSKLCNVLFTRELQRRLDKDGTGIKVNCFSPGLIVGTGLFRDQNPLFTKVFDIAATNLLKVGESVHWGGGTLEYMILDKTVASKGGLFYTAAPGSGKYGDDAYGKQFAPAEVSKEARDDAKARELWELSDKLLGASSSA
uniref:protochlorophyllide reductase n=1 Tax=Ditylum brightwellii TaxID=49249 RepID=A0A7S1ZYS0_9STRA|mmetsp:Transcript_4869/g.7475  ORF Transcript_4869/g.7475 Transcript_4869/m.7475 type:complete len:287 (+) Transcript_4869:392-1252(+)